MQDLLSWVSHMGMPECMCTYTHRAISDNVGKSEFSELSQSLYLPDVFWKKILLFSMVFQILELPKDTKNPFDLIYTYGLPLYIWELHTYLRLSCLWLLHSILFHFNIFIKHLGVENSKRKSKDKVRRTKNNLKTDL